MTLQVKLPPETEMRIRERAGSARQDVESFVLQAVAEKLAETESRSIALSEETTPLLPLDAWLREFDAWVSSHKSRNPSVDDSRDSIYPDRW